MAKLTDDEQNIRDAIHACQARQTEIERETEERVSRLEYEILGDKDAGRKSLRQELDEKMTRMTTIIIRIGFALLVALMSILGTLIWDKMSTRQNLQAAPSQQQTHQ
jgi:hypothetical protein